MIAGVYFALRATETLGDLPALNKEHQSFQHTFEPNLNGKKAIREGTQSSMITPRDRRSKIWPVVRVSSGNFLEMYDFMVFGYYATAIGHAFFPSGNPFLSLMLSLMTFGAGFLMRPLGAIVLGAYTDRHGRRAGLILTLGLMSPEERAAALKEAEPDNVIWLEQYRLH